MDTSTAKTYMDTPLGPLELTATEAGIRSVCFIDYPTYERDPTHPHLLQCIEQLEAYFRGEREHFTVFLDLQGTAFQQRVWRALREIPLGTTMSYLDIAKAIGAPEAVRAVGSACARNQHWLVVPCHRVIGSDGKLTGYAAGLPRKRWLLHHEQGMRLGQQTTLF